MIEDLFKQGNLEMSSTPISGVETMPLWSDFPQNKILMAISLLLILANMSMFFQMVPSIADCFRRTKGSIELEHSISMAKLRSICAFIMAIPFCLMASRYNLYRPEFFEMISTGWKSIFLMVVLGVFLLVRHLFFLVAHPRKLPQDVSDSAHHVLYTYFVPFVFLMLLSVGTLNLFKCPDHIIGTVLLWETALCYVLSFIRCGQILGSFCSGFSTILYLCALEILPTLLLVASAFKL